MSALGLLSGVMCQPKPIRLMVEYNIQESVLQSRLIPINKVNLILDRITFTMTIVFFTIFFWLPLLDLFNHPYIKIGFLLTVVILSFLLSTFKWNRAMKLKIIVTPNSESDNKELIKSVILNSGYTIVHNSIDNIQATDLLKRLELNFIIRKKEIYINTNYYFFRSIWPDSKICNKMINEITQRIKAGT